jgi:hypothetical protein
MIPYTFQRSLKKKKNIGKEVEFVCFVLSYFFFVFSPYIGTTASAALPSYASEKSPYHFLTSRVVNVGSTPSPVSLLASHDTTSRLKGHIVFSITSENSTSLFKLLCIQIHAHEHYSICFKNTSRNNV